MDDSHVDQVVKHVKDQLEMLRGPVTRGRSKKFKEALQQLMPDYQDGLEVHGDQVGGYLNIIEVEKDQVNEEKEENMLRRTSVYALMNSASALDAYRVSAAALAVSTSALVEEKASASALTGFRVTRVKRLCANSGTFKRFCA